MEDRVISSKSIIFYKFEYYKQQMQVNRQWKSATAGGGVGKTYLLRSGEGALQDSHSAKPAAFLAS